jgi:hypothetical protein
MIAQALEQANAQQTLNKSLLRITYIMQQSIHFSHLTVPASHSFSVLERPNSNLVIEMLLTQPLLLDNLRKGYSGNYGPILSLLGCLDHGVEAKKLVDRIIDACGFHAFVLNRLYCLSRHR